MRLVRVPLRISLVGGGTDIPSHYENYGGAVVSFTINKYIYITTKLETSLFPHKYRLVYSKVEECADWQSIQHPIIKSILRSDIGTNQHGLDLDVMSDVPAGTGLGSSSAFTVGLLQALRGWECLDKHQLAEKACNIELDILKEPIGKQDQYAAAFGGLNHISFSKGRVQVNPLSLTSKELNQLRKNLTLIYIGGTRCASSLLREQNTTSNTSILDSMRVLADELKNDLQKGCIDSVGHYLKEGWNLKKKLSPKISNDYIDNIINTAMEHGADGGKLLGAGGAGFILLHCPYKLYCNMMYGLIPFGLTYVPFNFDFEGCKTLYYED